ncbi:hypothetical protein L6452_06032 [Arctium lappa]|uniref:Uncharacterized protein n=1 Tax=Arctium lappa TaxID=4217 RepID=A0ACB9EHJ6_ARCLA|nr:hypothetical protein L6452_06032 [Arctium lappa]
MILLRIIKSPIRAISKALDLYAKYMTKFATNYNRPLMIMETIPNSQQLPNTPSDSDYLPGPLIRAIITTTATPVISSSSVATTTRPRVSRIADDRRMRTIDEDRAYSFRDDGIVTTKKLANKICFLVNSVRR